MEASLGHWAQRLWGKLVAKESCQVRPWGHCRMRVPVGWAQMHAPLGSSTGQATAFQMQGTPQSLGSWYQHPGSLRHWNGWEGGHDTWFKHTHGHTQECPRASGDSSLGSKQDRALK